MTLETCEQQARFFSALSHPVRLRILGILSEGEACVCHLCAILQQRQAYVSQQLAILKEIGLISDKKEGLYVYYRLANADIAQALGEVQQSLARLTGNEALLHIEAPTGGKIECSCPRCQTTAGSR